MLLRLTSIRGHVVQWWWQPNRRRLATANFAVVAVATLLAGTAALLVEDSLPKPGDGFVFVPERWITALLLLVLLGVTVRLRGHTHRSGGTLYYVHALAEGMSDRRRDALGEAADHHMAWRTITRWVDLTDNTNADGVIDIHRVATDIGATLENLINNDNPDTGYTVAPNMLWPIALAVGAYLPPIPRTRLLELNPPNRPNTTITLDGAPTITLTDKITTLAAPTGHRTGIVLAFTGAAAHFDTNQLVSHGVATVHTFTAPDSASPLTAAQIAALPRAIADALRPHLTEGTERVIVAFIPKTVALALGWELARPDIRFFTGTHLLHHDDKTDTYQPMRVHASQPATP
ncbi:hypothetical protein IU468_28180 [Nocardia farcinica]|uniref:hypothetical protein n=1 Tax=Nocardia TaxID=1817 RepID=UPI000BEF255B|nr:MULTISPECIES: hypothetical protein [Nocardia]MBF6260146.1 hypothetical protein [Nocardia farcinica]MBF6294622.1 hypothetical protein [Nocardia farcinica]MBF6314017.1 hypothetical protein [Nocardia farcinica]MBF6381794.1 hypothetical protein [Nocardia farcinica]MBF6388065.1 hypothetical protein [Nocardia farcinica]